jgi:hypothetical protein
MQVDFKTNGHLRRLPTFTNGPWCAAGGVHPFPKPLQAMTRTNATIVLLSSLLSSCGMDFHLTDPGAGITVLQEVEPNDQPWETQVFDPLESCMVLDLVGSVQAAPGFDLTDHLGFIAESPMEICVTLEGEFEYLDFDLAVWDPTSETYPLVWQTSGDVETAIFEVNHAGPFQLAVFAPFEDGDWILRIETFPLPGYNPEAGSAPGDRIQALKATREKTRGLKTLLP